MLITSAGIFGYLSNAFQSQSLKLQQVDREVLVYTTKIDQNTAQITQLNTQLGQLSSTQNTILDKGKVNSRLLRSIDQKDRQTAQINKKIEILQTENAKNNEKINEIKVSNLDLEKEVGGFRFIAEAFGMELKNVVKFFIFLIVIVFDPLAVALIIAFNGLIGIKNRKEEENLTENVKIEEPIRQNSELEEKNYQIYGDSGKNSSIEKNDEVIVENIVNEIEKNEINEKKEDEPVGVDDVVDDVTSNLGNLKWEEWMHPEFPWNNRKLWINNAKAVNYWLSTKGGNVRELSRLRSENENIKTY
jgi:hypothetical protein